MCFLLRVLRAPLRVLVWVLVWGTILLLALLPSFLAYAQAPTAGGQVRVTACPAGAPMLVFDVAGR